MLELAEIESPDALRLRLGLQSLVARAATSRSGELDALLDRCAGVIASALGADSLGIWVAADQAGELKLTARAVSPEEPQPEPMQRVSIGPEHVAAMSAVAHPAVFRSPRFRSPLFAEGLNGPERHMTAAPLMIDGNRLVGLLAMLHAEPLPAEVESTFASLVDPLALAVEKERAVERLHEREQGLGTMIRTAPDGMVMMDEQSRILATNPSLDRIFGYEEGELVGQRITALMPERFRPGHEAGIRRYSETGRKRVSWNGLELVGLRKDGTEFPIEISFGEFLHDGVRVFTGFIRDISERKRAEAQERRKRRVVQATAVYIGSSFVGLQALDVLLPVLPLPAWTFGAVVALAFVGLPVTAALAWTRERPGRAGPPAGRPGGTAPRKTARLGAAGAAWPMGVAVGLSALLATGLLVSGALASFGGGEPVIAALPVAAIGADPEVDALASGLTEDLLTELSDLPGLRVLSRTSVEALGGGRQTAAALARELGAGYVLEGSVRRVEGRVRVTARLVRAGRDQPVWSETFDRDLEDLLSLQAEVARAVAEGVAARLGEAATDPPSARGS